MMEEEKIINIQSDYRDRKSKAEFVYKKYKNILKGTILDVGADQGYLNDLLPEDSVYTGIGFGDNPLIKNIDLEKEKVPFPDQSFDCVLCLDVLEHLDNMYEMFDDLCRVSKEWIIISLPNPWNDFFSVLSFTQYNNERNTKFYGLPLERESDRHKWFFSSREAIAFIKYRSEKNDFEVYDLFIENENSNGIEKGKTMKQKIYWFLYKKAREFLFRKNLDYRELSEGTQWYTLRRKIKEIDRLNKS